MSKDKDVKFPDRDGHRAIFEELLGHAYAATVKMGPVAFLYIGQTSPEPTGGLVTQMAVTDAGEACSAIVNFLRTTKSAGRLDDAMIDKIIEKLQEMRG